MQPRCQRKPPILWLKASRVFELFSQLPNVSIPQLPGFALFHDFVSVHILLTFLPISLNTQSTLFPRSPSKPPTATVQKLVL